MKSDSYIHLPTKWRAQSPGVRSSRRLLAIKMNNFFDENSQEPKIGTWAVKNGKKCRPRRPRPLTATLARPRLLDITLLGKIDMSLMRKELLSVYRLMRLPIETHGRATIASLRDKKLAIMDKDKGPEDTKHRRNKSSKNDIIIDIRRPATDTQLKTEIRKDIMKDKSSFKLFPNPIRTKNKVDAIFGGPTNKPLPKPCDSCGRASRPERLHAHPQRLSISPSRINVSPASARRSAASEIPGRNSLDKLSTLQVNRSSSSCERRSSSSRKSAEDNVKSQCVHEKNKDENLKRLTERHGDAPPVCSFCGRRFGTTSLPIHEAKCREKRERKTSSTKTEEVESNKEINRELLVREVSPRKLSPRVFTNRDDSSRAPTPRRIEETRIGDLSIFHPSHNPPVRRSPINVTVVPPSPTHTPEPDDSKTPSMKGVDLEAEIEWKSHLQSLVKCNTCERAFAPDRVLRHQAICNGSSKRKGKPQSQN